MRPALLLNVGHSTVIAARKHAKTEPNVAAALLARAILTHHKVLDAALDDALTVHALKRVLR